jgi:putative nucleotidyltransferase with HDIG domain
MPIAEIDKIIEKMESVRILKNAALRVFQTANDPNATAEDISGIIEKDDFLAAFILKVANSSYYGNSGKVKSINDAVVLLGFTGIKSIAVASSLMAKSNNYDLKKSEILVREKLWRHSISTAISAKFVAEKVGFKDTGEAYITGMIHDIGRLAMFQYDEDMFGRVEKYSLEKNLTQTEAELAIAGLDHAQIGAIILSNWKFPDPIIQAVEFHHKFYEGITEGELIGVITIANFISNSLGFGPAKIAQMDPRIMKTFKLDYGVIKQFIEEISGMLSHIDILSIGI